MVKSKDDIITQLKSYLKDDTSDEALAILEDVSDTLDDSKGGSTKELEDKIVELQKQVEEVDTNWRKKYADRFDKPSPTPSKDETETEETETEEKGDETEPKHFEDLFTTEQ